MRSHGDAPVAIGLWAGCGFHPQAPREFARNPRGVVFKGPLCSVSPDGVLFTVRSEKNKPKPDLAFWRDAMKIRLSQAGYRVVADTTCKMNGADGALLKPAAPVGNQDFLYWIAFSLNASGSRILAAEAGGESRKILARQYEIGEAIAGSGW